MSLFAASGKVIIHYDESGVIIKVFDNSHTLGILCMALTNNGDKLVSGSNDNTIIIWEVATGTIIKVLTGHTSWVCSVAISPDDSTIVSGSYDNTIKLWDLQTGLEKATLQGHIDLVRSVAIIPTCDKIVSGSLDNTVRVWDIKSGALLLTLGHTNWVYSVIVTPNGQQIISGSHDGTIRLWNLSDGANTNIINVGSSVYSLAITSSGDKVVCGCGYPDFSVRVYALPTGNLERTITGHTDWVQSVTISPDQQHILSGSDDKTVKQVNVYTGELKKNVKGQYAIYAVTNEDFSGCMKNAANRF